MTVCAKVHYPDHSERVGWPPIRLRLIGDSATMQLRGGNTLTAMCGALRYQLPGDSVPVLWGLQWFTADGRRLLRPVPRIP